MNYPNDFDTSTFPAGKTIAFSRSVSIWIAVVFFCIIVACGLVLLLNNSKRNYPFLISSDSLTSDWTVVAYPEKNLKISHDRIIQESLVRNYVIHWFSINKNNSINESRWRNCESFDCESTDQYNPHNYNCALFCVSSQELFQQFYNNVMPEYRDRIDQASETIMVKSQLITPPTNKNSKAGLWQSYVELESSVNKKFDVLAFIELGHDDKGRYPATLGYYVKDFNAYRMVVKPGL
ncbi:MAG: hypothetical protein IJL05_00280 [Alphaproteobacteria bacterium]|nr:hypothetical protein [Alphaproteobacteria bacterium]